MSVSEASFSPSWLHLYQYTKRTFGGYKSAINAPRFFFSPNGRYDPEAELKAAIEAFESQKVVGTQNDIAACVFPARKIILEKILNRKFPSPECADLKEFIANIGADEAHLVFVGAYMGNPASIMGHTFLRFANSSRESQGREGLDLLSYSVGYQAVSNPSDSRIVYALKGLFGGYVGTYEIEKHYIKVGLYNNAESRDLWDLKIKLTAEEVRLLVMHFWELTFNSTLTYYFIDENCSYRLLTFLEAVKPDLDISRHLSNVVLPAETVRAMMEAHAVDLTPQFRASIKRRMQLKLELLSPEDLATFRRAKLSVMETKAIQNPTITDALLDYWLFENYKVHTNLTTSQRTIMEATYKRASELKGKSDFSGITNADIKRKEHLEPPFFGHKPKWIEGGLGSTQKGFTGAFNYRSGIQPLWSGDNAYREISAIEYFGADIQFRQDQTTNWNLLLIDARALENFTGSDGHMSWTVNVKATNDCRLCLSSQPQLEMSGGYGLALKRRRLVTYAFAHGRTEAWIDRGAQGLLAPGYLAGFKFNFSDQMTLLVEAQDHWWKKLSEFEANSRFTYQIQKNTAVYLKGEIDDLRDRGTDKQITIGSALFF